MKCVSFLALVGALLLPNITMANNQKQGQYFINFGVASNYYNYDSKDARDELDQNLEELLDEYDLSSDDADIVNASFGLGYYLTNDFAVRANYTYGIELDWLDWCFFDCFRRRSGSDWRAWPNFHHITTGIFTNAGR